MAEESNADMKMKLIPILVGLLFVGCVAWINAQLPFSGAAHVVERFIQRSDGWVVGILYTNGNMSLSSDIREVTWTAENGSIKVLRWDGTNVLVR